MRVAFVGCDLGLMTRIFLLLSTNLAAFILHGGGCPLFAETDRSLVWKFSDWPDDSWVFLPACAYNGNRDAICRPDWTRSRQPEGAGRGLHPVRQSMPVPALNPDGSGLIEVTSGDLAVPCAGVFFPGFRRGFLVFTEQQCGGRNVGFTVQSGEIRIDCPARRSKGYRGRRAWVTDPDGPNEASSAKPRYRVFDFEAPNVSEFIERFFRERNCLVTGPRASASRSAAVKRALSFWNSDTCWSGRYYAPERPGRWSPGWVGGVSTAYALAKIGDELTRQRAAMTVDYAVEHQTAAGFFRCKLVDSKPEPEKGEDLVRLGPDVIYHILRISEVLPSKPSWDAAVRRCADGFVRMWERYGQFGQWIDAETGEIKVGTSDCGALIPAALARTYVRFGDRRYLCVAEASLEQFCRLDLDRGVVYGGPSDILMSCDSESCAMLLESCVTLAEVTGSERWRAAARKAAALLSTWVIAYEYKFPADSEFARVGIHTRGAVFASVQNKHAAPGLCTLSSDSLVRLAKLTGDVAYRELGLDIAAFIPQTESTVERPLYDINDRIVPPGWVNERVNTSDWEGSEWVGEIFSGRCWCNTSLLLSLADLADAFDP